jgi:hypothetical protein
MDNVIRAAVILACVQFVCPAPRAADDAGSFATYGLGNRSCSEWTEFRARNDPDIGKMAAWTLGFISAYNKYLHKGIDVASGLDAEEIHALIDKHCKNRPRDRLWFAINALIEQLRKK